MVRILRAELGSEHGTVQRVAGQLGYGTESVRLWVRQARTGLPCRWSIRSTCPLPTDEIADARPSLRRVVWNE